MLTTQEFTRRTLIVVFVVVSVVLALLLIFKIYPTILLAFTCWVLAIALNIIVNKLEQSFRMKRGVAIGVTMLGVILISALFIVLVVPSFVRQIGDIVSELPGTTREALRNYADFRSTNTLATQVLPNVDPDNLTQTVNDLLGTPTAPDEPAPLDLMSILGSATSTLVAVGRVLGNVLLQIVLVLLLTIFLLIDPTLVGRFVVAIVPTEIEDRAIEILNEVRRTVRQWVGAIFLSTVATGFLYWVALGLILGLPNAIAMSVIGGIATIVPTVGPTIAIIPVIIFALAEGPTKMIVAVILYGAVGIIQDRVITPAIMQSELNIPPATLVLFQLVSASLLGFVGVLIAVPLLAVLTTLMQEIHVKEILGKAEGPPGIEEEGGDLVIVRPAPPIVHESRAESSIDEESKKE